MNTSGLSAVDHLRLGREGLIRQRAEIDAAVEAIDRVLSQLGQAAPVATEPVPNKAPIPVERSLTATGTPSVREAILSILASQDRDWTMAEIIDGVHALGTRAQDDTVRSIIIKRLNKGEIERPRRGQYRLARPKNAESPASTGLSVALTTTEREGGEGRDPASPHTDNDSLSRWNGSHDRNPAVVG